jgi:hypothetical protein
MTRYLFAGLFWLALSPSLTASIRIPQDRFSAVSQSGTKPASKGPHHQGGWQDAKQRQLFMDGVDDDEKDQAVLKRVHSFEIYANGWFLLTMSALSWYHVSWCLGLHSTSMTRSTLFLLISSLSNVSCGLVHLMACDRPSKSLEPASLNTSSIRKWYRGLMKFAVLHVLLTVYIFILFGTKDTISDDVSLLFLTLLAGNIALRDLKIPTLRHPMTRAKLGYTLVELFGFWPPMLVLSVTCVTAVLVCWESGRVGWAVGVGVLGLLNLLASGILAMELETIHMTTQLLTLFAKQRVARLVRILNFWWMLTILALCGLISCGVAIRVPSDVFQDGNTFVFHPGKHPLITLLLFWMSLPYFIQHCAALFINKEGMLSLSEHNPSLEEK